MRRLIRFVPLLSIGFICVTASATIVKAEQKLPMLRVVKDTAYVRTRPSATSEVRKATTQGMMLEAVDRQDDWYWVMLPADENGTRRPGWIDARDVEVVSEGQPDTVLRHLAQTIEAAKARDLEQAATKAAEVNARLDRARLQVERARRDYEAAASETPGTEGHSAAPTTRKPPKRRQP
jgi:hypothetical protein